MMLRMLENNPNNSFASIPHSMWWAVVTMCTVGMYITLNQLC